MVEGKRLIAYGVGSFVVVGLAVAFLGARMVSAPEELPRFVVSEVANDLPNGTHQATLDSTDHKAWKGYSLDLGRVVPEGPAADIYVRRHLFRAPRGAVDLGPVALSDATMPDDVEWDPEALSRWYAYNYFSHQLPSKGHSYGVRTADGVVFVAIDGYLCGDGSPGCLTIRYRPLRSH